MTQAINVRSRIFISYRRDDARGASGRLYDWLRIAFGRDQVFRDVASIGPGKWRQKIDEALAASAVCLPVIGLRWCDATNGPRLADENDMVRHELITALAHSDKGLTIILTLVEGAKVPSKTALPNELHALTRALEEAERGADKWERMVALTILGDLALRTMHLSEAVTRYSVARNIVMEEAARDPANTQWQRDLSVSHDRIGDVLVAQGDGPGALASYQKGLAIRDALAARDPANTQWQRDLIVSYVKLSEVTGDKAYVRKALDIAQTMQKRGTLQPRDAWMVDELKRRSGQ